MAIQLLAAAPSASAVVDEPAHLVSGCLALAEGDLTVNREHPPLAKLLAALPVALLHPVLPPIGPDDPPRAGEDFEFAYSRRFLYQANDADRLLAAARLPIMLMAVVAALILYLWARSLLGPGAALAGLALTAFEPNLLAHGRLVTTDMAATLFTLATFACLERSLAAGAGSRRLRWIWTAAAGASLGLGLLSRFSCLLMIPILALALALDTRVGLRRRLLAFVAVAGVALAVVNGFYVAAGRGAPSMIFPLAQEPETGALRTAPLSRLEADPVLRWLPVPLPRLYLEGLDLARYKNLHEEGPAYLNGEYSSDGWWSYFVLALGMKVTLPMLALAAGGILALSLRGPHRRRFFVWIVVPMAGTVALTTALTRAQIGLRYVLPALPFLCLAGGAAAAALIAGAPDRTRRRLAVGAVAAALAWHAGGTLAVHPYHLAYFNEAAGGPDRGYLHLVDSNLDWGQDLVGLSRFLRARGIDRVNLYYFGTADPAWYGIHRNVPPEPGYFAVSATHLMGVYLPDRDYLAPFRTMKTETTIGHSILVYRLDEVPPFLKIPIRRR